MEETPLIETPPAFTSDYPLRDKETKKKTGNTFTVEVWLPEIDPKSPHKDYRCRFKIQAPGLETPDKPTYTYGIDELQAIFNAFSMITAEIHNYNAKSPFEIEYFFAFDHIVLNFYEQPARFIKLALLPYSRLHFKLILKRCREKVRRIMKLIKL